MKKTRTQLQEDLEGKSKEIIEKLLDWNETHPSPTLTQIEEVVLELREALGLEFVSGILAGQEKGLPVVEKCKVCGQEMRQKGRKRKAVESRVGEVVLERGYYYCEACGAGIFPPGSAIRDQGWAK